MVWTIRFSNKSRIESYSLTRKGKKFVKKKRGFCDLYHLRSKNCERNKIRDSMLNGFAIIRIEKAFTKES